MAEHFDSIELAKELEARHRARRARLVARRIEEARAETLVSNLAVVHDGADARLELRSNLDRPSPPPRAFARNPR